MTHHTIQPKTLQATGAAFAFATALFVAAVWQPARAAVTDVAQQPLITSTKTPIKPNLMFVLDDSGSMAWTYLPEAASGFSASEYGSRAAQCNGLAYNPSATYQPPSKADGTDENAAAVSGNNLFDADQGLSNVRSLRESTVSVASGNTLTVTVSLGGTSWSSASGWYAAGNRVAVYDSVSKTRWGLATVTGWSRVNASDTFGTLVLSLGEVSSNTTLSAPRVGKGLPNFVYWTYAGTQPRLGFTYDASGNAVTTSTFFTECNSVVDATPGSAVFNLAAVRTTDAQAQNFANWNAYHRTRMAMMKTVVSRAFKDIDDRFRVGYNTILNTSAKEGSLLSVNQNFLHPRDFEGSQKSNFYSRLNAATPTGYTPLRASLSFMGRYFANKLGSKQDYDPMQYSCQKNFTILSTDGAWNTNAESLTYGPFAINGTSNVGQQDGSLAPPFKDAGSTDSLADVAQYYYATDLRTSALGNCDGSKTGVQVCANNVEAKGRDTATHQHMTTYTLSLGQNGSIPYSRDYETQASGPFYNIRQGAAQWPNPTTDAYKVDDLWHAAVNGRGLFFNGADSTSVSEGIKAALAEIDSVTGSGAAAATSTLRPVAGNNTAFIAQFTSGTWTGDLRAYPINVDTGDIERTTRDAVTGNDGQLWSASRQLAVATSRNLYYGNGSSLRAFTYANLSADGYGGDFNNKGSALSQYGSLSPSQQSAADSGANMVAYLSGTEFGYYRSRGSKLADFVSSAPVYDGTNAARYADAGYSAFVTARASRTGVVYVGSNGGFMHAFDARNGNELWAFMPAAVRGQVHQLASNNYLSNHRFFVDGAPTLADVKIAGNWRTILVFGLGAGGRSYTAMDVTDPANPQLLWEFTDNNLGLTHAKPLVTKRKSGQWVVVVPSGYNNVSPGDGKGHLFMIDVATGAKVLDLSTSAGSTSDPAGLGPLNSWVEAETDNTSLRFYAGDNLGNLWRFDTEGLNEPKNAAMALARFEVSGVGQPVSTMPVIAEVDIKGFKTPVVYIGTGRSVGTSDLTNGDTQSIYAIRDPLTASGWGNVRATAAVVPVTAVTSGSTRTSAAATIDWTAKAGWYLDLPDSKERITVPMRLFGNTLVAASNVPVTLETCGEGDQGYAWLYYLNIANGAAVSSKIMSSQVAGMSILTLQNGRSVTSVIPVLGEDITDPVQPAASYSNRASRTNWRSLSGR